MRPLIAGNWKMYKTIREAEDFCRRLRETLVVPEDRDVVVAPPFPALKTVADLLVGTSIGVAAQNVSDAAEGAFTGEVSAAMLADAGCAFVIVGHSERRRLYGETDALVAQKIAAVQDAALTPIVCIGETLEERESGATFDVVARQLKEGLKNLSADAIWRIVLAYEPVWAIGTGRTATPEQAQEVHAFVRRTLGEFVAASIVGDMRILYGGSVNAGNIDALMAQHDINGALVGGASLDVASFARIVQYH